VGSWHTSDYLGLSVAQRACVFQPRIFRSGERALRLPRKRRSLFRMSVFGPNRPSSEWLRRQADDRLLRLQFAIIIAPGNLRPCRGQNYVPVFGLLLPDLTRMVCIWRKTSDR
jgi:hypothetical protein